MMTHRPELLKTLSELYGSEINAGVSSFWDDGFLVWIGDDLNGRKTERRFYRRDRRTRDNDTFRSWQGVWTAAAEWLHDEAVRLYPQSDYANATCGDSSASNASPKHLRPLARAALPSDPVALARFLIGVSLVRRIGGQTMSARIVETEAYTVDDPASHGYNGLTKRNAVLFDERGRAYIYRIYGAWWCLNVSAGRRGEGGGVLIRAAEPLAGMSLMQRRRPNVEARDLLRGPGRLCEALAIDADLNGVDLTQNRSLWLSSRQAPANIGESVRIGLRKAEDAVRRFYDRGSRFLSGPARLNR